MMTSTTHPTTSVDDGAVSLTLPYHPHPLLTSTVMTMLFNKLDYGDRKNCRLVCSAWDDEISPSLRASSNFRNHNREQETLEQLMTIYEDKNFPFSGFSIRDWAANSKTLDQFFQKFGASLDFLKFEWTGRQRSVTDGYSEFMNKVLFEWTPNLVELDVSYLHQQFQFLNGGRLPNIRRLTLFNGRGPEMWKLALLQSCTKVQSLIVCPPGDGGTHWFKELVIGSPANICLTTLDVGNFQSNMNITLEPISYNALWNYEPCRFLSELSLNATLSTGTGDEAGRRCTLIVDVLSNIPTLTSLYLRLSLDGHLSSPLPLPIVGSKLLPNLKRLNLHFLKGKFEIDEGIDFLLWIPNLRFLLLEEFGLNNNSSIFNLPLFGQSRGLLASPHVNLKTLILQYSFTSTFVQTSLMNLSRFFPNPHVFKIQVSEENSPQQECVIDTLMSIFASSQLRDLSIGLTGHYCNLEFGRYVLSGLERLELSLPGFPTRIENTVPMPTATWAEDVKRLSWFQLVGYDQEEQGHEADLVKQRMAAIPFIHVKGNKYRYDT